MLVYYATKPCRFNDSFSVLINVKIIFICDTIDDNEMLAASKLRKSTCLLNPHTSFWIVR